MTSGDRRENSTGLEEYQTALEHPELLGAAALLLPSVKQNISTTIFENSETQLSPEQQAYARNAIVSMAESLGVRQGDFRLVLIDSDESVKNVVAIDASPNGQHIGLYMDILAKRREDNNWYTIEIDGKRVDPLVGCTKASYRAMIDDARAGGEQFLPDSLALNQHNGHVWTATMLTGEPLPSEDKIWIGSSSGGTKVNFVEHPIHRGGRSFRVRPAVVVGQIET